ncbi:hypothetical protein L2719_05910 [Shewanella schlegeliana]|uniref:Uncharacterized protein n=1 Tax=Shewanella schlegeliana TaxID=190308 RepID=A0ABS1SWC1_9GAMM|nr:hypothetical protein [Shewanella schlegeliana]MBL4912818.1 hypothetical protein [Shewanella schlegeliana]MCL1109085.1 hypothetical protein [Shewanella schlegeliana]GIU23077.1 hypothetical protein TUM4433_04880 [Shewanella schlegeliana]
MTNSFYVSNKHMDNYISPTELFWHAVELEKFESVSIEDQVIEKCLQAKFLNTSDLAEKTPKLAWIKQVTAHAADAFKLESIANDDGQLTLSIHNLKKIKAHRDEQVNDILELLAKRIVSAAPDYKV